MLRRLKIEVEKDLPPKKETLVYVGMSKLQKRVYKSILMREIHALSGGTKQKTQLLNIVMQLRKAANHPYLFDNVEDRSLDPFGRHLIDNSGFFFFVSCVCVARVVMLVVVIRKDGGGNSNN